MIFNTFARRLVFVLVASCGLYASPALSIQIENMTSYEDQSVSNLIRSVLPPDWITGLSSSQYALIIFSDTIKREKDFLCIGIVGLTHKTQKALNPRIPANRFSIIATVSADTDDESDANGCAGSAVLKAAEALSKTNWQEQAKAATRTANSGGTYVKGERKAGVVNLYWGGDVVLENLFPTINATDFGHAFDHRITTIVGISSHVASLQRNEVACYAMAGVSATPPEGRNARFPGYWRGYFRWFPLPNTNTNSIEMARKQCEIEASKSALTSLLQEPWTTSGILKDIAASREEGLPVVKKPMRVTSSSPTNNQTYSDKDCRPKGKVLRCTYTCENGSCILSYENGCKLRKTVQPEMKQVMEKRWDSGKYNLATGKHGDWVNDWVTKWVYPSPGC